MIDKDKQYKTRDGRDVRIYATDGAEEYPVHGAVKNDDVWYLARWKQNGTHAGEYDSSNDLIEVKPRIKIERWALVERDGSYSLWLDKPSNASSVDAFAITRISFEVEEGEGIDAV
jgi:hypothetical protein